MELILMTVNDTEHFVVISAVLDFIQQKTGLLQNVRQITQVSQTKGLDNPLGFVSVGGPKILKPVARDHPQCGIHIDHNLLITLKVGYREGGPLLKTEIQEIEFRHCACCLTR